LILLIVALVLGAAGLAWLWKVPIMKMVQAMKNNGSNSFEAYFVVFLLIGGLGLAVYLIANAG
jgi:hypothetical protein